MNQLPVAVREPGEPYLKPHSRKKQQNPRLAKLLVLVLALAMIAILAFCFHKLLPDGLWGGIKTPEQTTESAPPPETTTNLYEYHPEAVPAGAFGIRPCDKSARTLGLLYENPAEIALPDKIATLTQPAADHISVLVLTTHPYESYATSDHYFYSEGAAFSGGEIGDTVVAAAEAFTGALNAAGIHAVFLPLDTATGQGSYAKAEAAILHALAEYPDVCYIFDLHRGLLLDEDGTMYRPVIEGENGALAQLRFLVGSGYDTWQDTFAATAALSEKIGEAEPYLLMPTLLSESRLNQHLTPTTFTVEIGTGGNSAAEACRAAVRLGELFADAVKG